MLIRDYIKDHAGTLTSLVLWIHPIPNDATRVVVGTVKDRLLMTDTCKVDGPAPELYSIVDFTASAEKAPDGVSEGEATVKVIQ